MLSLMCGVRPFDVKVGSMVSRKSVQIEISNQFIVTYIRAVLLKVTVPNMWLMVTVL